DWIPAHAEAPGHFGVAIVLHRHLDAPPERLRDVTYQQTCWIRKVSGERPADERDRDRGRGGGRRGCRRRGDGRKVRREDVLDHRRGAPPLRRHLTRNTFVGEFEEELG